MTTITTLATFIQSRRMALGIQSQTELARIAGIPRETVNRIERGLTQNPEANVRRRLAKALNVRHVDLLVAAGELTEAEIDDVAPLSHDDPDIDLISESWAYLDRLDREVVKRVVQRLAETSDGYDADADPKAAHG